MFEMRYYFMPIIKCSSSSIKKSRQYSFSQKYMTEYHSLLNTNKRFFFK